MDNDINNKKNILSKLYVILIIVICIMPFLLFFVCPENNTSENRKLADFPHIIDETGGYNYGFMSDLGAYFEDRFALRSAYVSLDSAIKEHVFLSSPDNSVIVGKDGWLYYSATLNDYMRKELSSDRKLYNIARNVRLMQEHSEKRGAAFVFTIAPNKNTLYPSQMPERYLVDYNKLSDLDALTPYLEAENVNYVNLCELFKSKDEVLYFKRDSHWNKKGAVLAYNAMLDAAGKDHESYDDIETIEVYDYIGDLNKMLYPMFSAPEKDIRYLRDYTWQYVGYADDVTDDFILTDSENGEGSLLMYRDSFGNSLIDLMSEEFGSSCFSKSEPYDLRDLENATPDTFIIEKVERHLHSLAEVCPLMDADMSEDVDEYYLSLINGGKKDDSFHFEIDALTDTYADACVSMENGFVKIYGHVDYPDASDDMHIFAEISSGDDIAIYEAFCISDKESDYGFTLYLSPTALGFSEEDITALMKNEKSRADDLGIRIFILQNGKYKTVFENDIIINDLEQLTEKYEQAKADALAAKEKKEAEEAAKKAEDEKKRREEEQKALEEKNAKEALKAAKEQEKQTKKNNEKTPADNNSGVYEVSRVYYEDCGADTGYWEITWSDGSVTYVDD